MRKRIIESHLIPKSAEGERFSEYARKVIKLIDTRNGIYKAIKRGELVIDGKSAETGRFLHEGQLIELIDNGEQSQTKIFKLDLQVVFEDDYLAIINKPPGFEVMSNKFKTIENALPFNLQKSSLHDSLNFPRPVHRLDFPTSGLLICAKTGSALVKLSRMFEEKKVQKTYEAIVIGSIPEKGTFTSPIEERQAVSDFILLNKFHSLKSEVLSLVKLYPRTGRTHQLRIHLARNNTPILGDSKYGKKGLILRSKGLFLAAISLEFIHPFTNQKMNIEIPHPNKFDTYLAREQRRWEKYFTASENNYPQE